MALFHASSVERLDASLRAASSRADDATGPGIPGDPGRTVGAFLSVPGQPEGTLGGIVIGGEVTAGVIDERADPDARSRCARDALADVPPDGQPTPSRPARSATTARSPPRRSPG